MPSQAIESYLTAERYIAFIDILGFASMVRGISKEIGQDDLLRNVESALSRMARVATTWNTRLAPEYWCATTFSDNIVISVAETSKGGRPLLELLALTCSELCAALLEQGVLTRGGIVRGRLRHNNGLVFGEGLVDAYELESSVAIYPRVVISEEVVSRLDQLGLGATHVRRDFDGICHLHYLSPEQHPLGPFDPDDTNEGPGDEIIAIRNQIVRVFGQANKPGVRAKHHWLANYFNECAGALGLEAIATARER